MKHIVFLFLLAIPAAAVCGQEPGRFSFSFDHQSGPPFLSSLPLARQDDFYASPFREDLLRHKSWRDAGTAMTVAGGSLTVALAATGGVVNTLRGLGEMDRETHNTTMIVCLAGGALAAGSLIWGIILWHISGENYIDTLERQQRYINAITD